MIRNLLILLVFLGIGFGASVAQSDIFVRQTPKEEASDTDKADEPQKSRSIFLRRTVREDSKAASVRTNFNTRLNVKGVRDQIARDAKTLAYWKQRDTRPQNIEELRSYVYAMRVNEREQILKDMELTRVKLAQMEQKHAIEFQAYLDARTPNPEAVREASAAIAAKNAEREAIKNGVQRVRTDYGSNANAQRSVTKIYRSRKSNTLEKPQRVFRDYR